MSKKIIRTASALLAVIMVVFSFASCSLSQKGSEYRDTENGSAALYRYKGSSVETELTVPDEYEGKKVTELMAFSLANAEYLKVIRIGKNIEKIDVWALTNCPLLERFEVSEENPYFRSVDGVLYNKDMTELIAYPNGKTPLETDDESKVIGGGELILPETVKTVRENACYLCGNLYKVVLNEGLEEVGNKAFLKCGNVKELNLPSTLKKIGVDSFSYWNALTELTIPANVEEIGDYAFFSTSSSIEKITVEKKESDIKLGKDWIPHVKDKVQEKVPVEFAK